ncbi:hypothetical protein BGX27_008163 [Mortierella sp. AM989]|nr:hypothetical protein BGX27_008163 [Mortierella sp. AM989]
MLEASSLRSRKHSSSPTDTKSSNTILNKEKAPTSIMVNDSGTSLSDSAEKLSGNDINFTTVAAAGSDSTGDNGDSDEEMKDASLSPLQEQQQQQSGSDQKHQLRSRSRSQPHSTTPREKLSAEDLNGGLLDGALDDIDDDEDLDRDTEDTDGVHPEHEGAEDEDEGDDEKEQDSVDTHDELPAGDADETSTQQSEEHEGDITMADPDDEGEDEATPAVHTEDEEESEMPEEEEGSHAEDDDDEDDDEEDVEDEDDEQPSEPEVKKDASSYSQKPTLNRPQIIEEELKDSGDDLSDLSDFTDDSDEDEANGPTLSNKAKVGANSAAANTSANTRQAPSTGGRKRSLRDSSRGPKEQEDKPTTRGGLKELERRNQHSEEKESESDAAEEEEAAEDGKVDGEEDGEEEDIEKKQKHMDALDALTTIEEGFATLRDKMYEERMLELDREVEMIHDGTHPELSTLMREIEDKREHRLRIAKAWRTHMGEIAQCEFEIKEYQAHCSFQVLGLRMLVGLKEAA